MESQIEFIVGEYYQTRDKQKAECLSDCGLLLPFKIGDDIYKVYPNGLYYDDDINDLDIVGPWTEPQSLKLEVGKWYKAENGEVAVCDDETNDEDGHLFWLNFNNGVGASILYLQDGTPDFDGHDPLSRIIREVPNPNETTEPTAVCERKIPNLWTDDVKQENLQAAHEQRKSEIDAKVLEGVEIEPQESEDKNEAIPAKSEAPFKFGLMTTEEFQKHLTETVANKKAQRERNLLKAIGQLYAQHEQVPSWMLEEILSLRSEQPKEQPTEQADGRNFEELEVGGVYERRDGTLVKIINYTPTNIQPYETKDHYYSANGSYFGDVRTDNFDLIRKIN
jgi:hypothetical protein